MLYADRAGRHAVALAQIPGGTLPPGDVPKFRTPLLIPPVMPRAGTAKARGGKTDRRLRDLGAAVRPAGPAGRAPGRRTVWGYGPVAAERSDDPLIHNAPSLTIEAKWNRPVRVKWINELVDASGNHLPHLLPVDPTLHWANPPGGTDGRDMRPMFDVTPGAYDGPVPLVTHVHGSVGVGDESDGYAEAWYLPAAADIPPAMRPRAPGTTSSRRRRAPSTASSGGRASRCSSTPTTSANRRSGTTTTRSG